MLRAFSNASDAPWIEAPDSTGPVLRKTFEAKGVIRARMQVSALGYADVFLNGRRITEDRFWPVWSDYHQRDLSGLLYPIRDRFSYSVYYQTFDVTDWIREGVNVLVFFLGNGFYHQNRRNIEGNLDYGPPKCFVHLVLEGEQTLIIDSDETFRYTDGPITENNVYYGETFDARLMQDFHRPSLDDSSWRRAVRSAPFQSVLRLSHCPNDCVTAIVKPKLYAQQDDRTIYDCGLNLSGVARIVTSAPAGQPVVLRFAERLTPDGHLDFSSCGGEEQIQQDVYWSDGTAGQVFEPRFVWHGFRYFEISGCYDEVEVLRIHTAVTKTGNFTCDHPVLNWLSNAYCNTLTSNLHGGVQSDCPHRERLGYTGDGQATAKSALYYFDLQSFYRKWMRDILDGQCRQSGHVQHTAPFYGGGGGPGGWGGAVVLLPWTLYNHSGDISLLQESFEPACRYLSYLKSRLDDGLVSREEEGGWCLGDWGFSHVDVRIDPRLVNTYFYIKCLRITREMARLLGRKDLFEEEEKAAVEAFERAFHRPDGSYDSAQQAPEAFAIDLGLGDEKTASVLAARYEEREALDTGIFGTPVLLRALTRIGRPDLAVRLLTSRAPGSFGHLMDLGATTLWEFLEEPQASNNHPMFGTATAFLFETLLGLQRESAGYRRVWINPYTAPQLGRAAGHIDTPQGPLSVSWTRQEGSVLCQVCIPEGIEAFFGPERLALSPGTTDLCL